MISAYIETKRKARRSNKAATARPDRHVQDGVADDERQSLRDEGLTPDAPAVIAAIDLVRWELSLGA